jgi:ribonuclease BN (tRNA processing enzyme)
MNIRFLGAHNVESKESRCACLVIDGVLALDAGALTGGLSQAEQQKLKAIVLTHQHFDHIRDIPIIGMNFYLHRNTLDIYTTRTTYDILTSHLLDNTIYPDFFKRPPEKPALVFKEIEALQEVNIAGYQVLPVPVKHAVPTVGLEITSGDGKKVFYSSDTGPSLDDVWTRISPHLLIVEVTALNKYHDFALDSGHLTAALLQQELVSFRKIRGYLPRTVLVHINPLDEKGIKDEIAAVAKNLNTEIQFASEGLTLTV